MKKLLILLLLVPSLSWGEILNIKFPFKLFCQKNHYDQIYYKILHGVSNNEFYFYEVSNMQAEYQTRVKTKLELEILNKDIIGLTENFGQDYKRILYLNIIRRDLSIQFETRKLITENFEYNITFYFCLKLYLLSL